MFTEDVRKVLEDEGWSPDRKVDATRWVEPLEAEGFAMFPEAVKILESFGGLKIYPPPMPLDRFVKGWVKFDPSHAEFDRVEQWQLQLNTKLSPFAEDSRGSILLLAEDGRVFIMFDSTLFLCGASFEDAMENSLIVAKRQAVEIWQARDYMFTDTVKTILEASGWRLDRRVDTAEWVAPLETLGFTMVPDALTILESFGGLTIVPQQTPWDTFAKETLVFDPVRAASGQFDRIEHWEESLSTKLSPVAEDSKGGILLISMDEPVFMVVQGHLFHVGSWFEDAMENTLIVAKRGAVEVREMSD